MRHCKTWPYKGTASDVKRLARRTREKLPASIFIRGVWRSLIDLVCGQFSLRFWPFPPERPISIMFDFFGRRDKLRVCALNQSILAFSRVRSN
jgi:hypothetical protein